MICDNISVNQKGRLAFAGLDTVDLAKKYGTPLYLMDEDKIRENIRTYKTAMAEYFPQGSVPEFASKAFSCKQIYRIAKEEEINIDVVSCGEIYTASSAGFPMENSFFHGNNKSDSDIVFAMDNNVGHFVCDSLDELGAINSIAKQKGKIQKVLLRLTPGIDPHTHKKIATGSVDSKFGFAIETGDATDALKNVLNMTNISLLGFHCHIGSQIFDAHPFMQAAEIMLDFVAAAKKEFGFDCQLLNIGGGFGVRYLESDPVIDYKEMIARIGEFLNKHAEKKGISLPKILMEPGRSIVANAGMTLYTVGSIKEIKGYKNYVSVDGGMADNPRYTLYEAPYTVALANRMNDKKDFIATVAGRCCESGDILQENVAMPKPCRNEILAFCTTGAYNYSMASNYNRLPKPPVVMIKDGTDYLAVKGQTFDDIAGLDV